jgi:hypothetical protein
MGSISKSKLKNFNQIIINYGWDEIQSQYQSRLGWNWKKRFEMIACKTCIILFFLIENAFIIVRDLKLLVSSFSYHLRRRL